MNSTKYTKKIEVTDTGMVIASVYRTSDSKRVGLEFFNSIIKTQRLMDNTCKRAHNWTDWWIKMCEDNEC